MKVSKEFFGTTRSVKKLKFGVTSSLFIAGAHVADEGEHSIDGSQARRSIPSHLPQPEGWS
jgi:hypothetical protein